MDARLSARSACFLVLKQRLVTGLFEQIESARELIDALLTRQNHLHPRADGAKISVPRVVLTIEPSDGGVLVACANTHRAIVMFFRDARVAMIEKGAGEVRMIATVDGGC